MFTIKRYQRLPEHVNNDTYTDLLVTAWRYNQNASRCYLYYGGPSTIDTTPDKILDGESAGDNFGRFHSMGDVDGDGYDDIVAGARECANSAGRAYLYWGAEGTSMSTSPGLVFDGESAGDQLGARIKVADIDGDGGGEILIGARYYNSSVSRLYLYWGGTRNITPGSADLTFTGIKGTYNVGDGLDFGQFRKDNYLDIITGGHPGRDDSAAIFYGGDRASMDNVADMVFTTDSACTFGAYICAVDFNNDGYDEVVIGDYSYPDNNLWGRVYIYLGPFADTTDITFNWDTSNTSPGKHTLKASIAPVTGEEDVADNTMTVTVEVKERRQ